MLDDVVHDAFGKGAVVDGTLVVGKEVMLNGTLVVGKGVVVNGTLVVGKEAVLNGTLLVGASVLFSIFCSSVETGNEINYKYFSFYC